MKRVVLIGDSIRMGYQDVVRAELAGVAEALSPNENGGDSANVLANLNAWVVELAPDVVHVNAGLHDIKKAFDTGIAQVGLAPYEQNVRTILSRLQAETNAAVIWALTTPVNYVWHHENKGFDRFEEDVDAYNSEAAEFARELGVPINDLFSVVMAAGRDSILTPDGVHITTEGYEVLGKAVAAKIRPCLG